MRRFVFDDCPLSGIAYGGTERKLGIYFDSVPFMLKFRKRTAFGQRYNHISEYLGSHIYQMIGLNAQDTILGTYKGEDVVGCRDFVGDEYQFVPFNDIGESTIEADREQYQYSYEDIVELLNANRKLTDVNRTISEFFNVYIVDAFLGNFDRHGSNWGFLKKNNKYELAPVFDNGSCLYPNMTNEDEMRAVIKNEEEIDKRVYKYPTSQIMLDGKKSSYYEVISSLKYDRINEALVNIYPRIHITEINELIEDIDTITGIHKEFYKVMIKNRYEKILKESYLRLMEG